jgi:nucleoside phosphorylase
MAEERKDNRYEESIFNGIERKKADKSCPPVELSHKDYTVGWVCALPKEQTAATAMLDQLHPHLPQSPNDHNVYTLGSIGRHNVVIACLPKGRIGTNSAATVATQMADTFQHLKFGLLVGIGGGIPPKVRLGDVVVSTPVNQYPGVVQWDLGKAEEGGNFKETGALNNPPHLLLAASTKLETYHDMADSKISEYLEDLKEKWPKLAPKYIKSDTLKDILFKADNPHRTSLECEPGRLPNATVNVDLEEIEEEEEAEDNCRFCDMTKVIKRKPRDMRIHYGLIASGNQVIKNAKLRDQLNKRFGRSVLCVEMEAAGLMNNFPCIVIRGICDYADSHKNKDWQEHAAATAAAFAKELLSVVPAQEVDQMPTIHNSKKYPAHKVVARHY